MSTQNGRRKVAAVLAGCAIFGAASCCAPPTYETGPDFGPDPELIPPLCMERDSQGNPVEVPCGDSTCWILPWANNVQADRESELYLTWRFEDDGEVYGYSVVEDDPIWNTVPCALSDGDSGL